MHTVFPKKGTGSAATNGAMMITKQSVFFVWTYSIVYVNNFGVRLKEKSFVEVNWMHQPQEQLVLLVRWVGRYFVQMKFWIVDLSNKIDERNKHIVFRPWHKAKYQNKTGYGFKKNIVITLDQ